MFGLGVTEILVILVIALLFVGPEKLPFFIKTTSQYMRKFQRTWNQLKYEVKEEVDGLVEKEEIADLTKSIHDFQTIPQNLSVEKLKEEVLDTKNLDNKNLDAKKKKIKKNSKTINKK